MQGANLGESNTKSKTSQINQTFSYGIIYVYSIPDKKHAGRLKIGRATLTSSDTTQGSINAAATARIEQQTKTADIAYQLEHAELAVTNSGEFFSDTDVHNVLIRSGYERKAESVKNARSEWFEVTLDVAKSAITAVKNGRSALTTREKQSSVATPFQFRPNQLDAIEKTTKAIKRGRTRFLWNAKMRFGKTSAAMQVAKVNEMQKVLIVTHRPSVSVDWYDDFTKVFAGTNYEYASKTGLRPSPSAESSSFAGKAIHLSLANPHQHPAPQRPRSPQARPFSFPYQKGARSLRRPSISTAVAVAQAAMAGAASSETSDYGKGTCSCSHRRPVVQKNVR